MTNKESTECPVCNTQVTDWTRRPADYEGNRYDCPNCGLYTISEWALGGLGGLDARTKAALSFHIWQRQAEGEASAEICTTHLDVAKEQALPDPREQLDPLILYLGKSQRSPGSWESTPPGCLRAKIGAVDRASESFIKQSAEREGIAEGKDSGYEPGHHVLRLTMLGWQRYHELQRGAVPSQTAFMAMPFGDEDVRHIVDDVFRPAVKETGFTLKRVDDDPRAGLIDDRIRVDIRLSRFLIADPTGGNHGAY